MPRTSLQRRINASDFLRMLRHIVGASSESTANGYGAVNLRRPSSPLWERLRRRAGLRRPERWLSPPSFLIISFMRGRFFSMQKRHVLYYSHAPCMSHARAFACAYQTVAFATRFCLEFSHNNICYSFHALHALVACKIVHVSCVHMVHAACMCQVVACI